MSAGDPLVDVPVRDIGPDGSTVLELRSWPNVAAKVAYLAELANAGARRTSVAVTARTLGTIERVHAFVRDRVRYEDEPIEMLETPAYVLAKLAADCEGQAVLQAALALALGHSSALVPMGGTPEDPAHLAIMVRRARVLAPIVIAVDWQPWGLRAPASWAWAETTVRAAFGEIPIVAAQRVGSERADLGG